MRIQLLIIMIIFAIHGSVSGQPGISKYNVYINPALKPGSFNSYDRRLYLLEKGELKVMNLVKIIGDNTFKNIFQKDTLLKQEKSDPIYLYDTTLYALTTPHQNKVIETLRSVHCMNDFMSDPNIIDGLRFIFSCQLDTTRYTTWISNIYHPQIAVFIEIINSYVPEEWKIWYDKEALLNWTRTCD